MSSHREMLMRPMWRKAGGKYALIVIGAWLLVSALSFVWTPYSLLDTNGFNAWASPPQRTRWAPTAPVPTC